MDGFHWNQKRLLKPPMVFRFLLENCKSQHIELHQKKCDNFISIVLVLIVIMDVSEIFK